MSRKEEIEKTNEECAADKKQNKFYVDINKMWERGKTLEDRETGLN